MRIAVYPHMLGLGGSQLNAVELAAGVRDLGHEVVVFGQPGPLVERVEELGLEFVPAPRPRGRPSPPVVRALRDLVLRRDIDLVHGYEWTTALEAYWGVHLGLGVPAMATVMSMAVAPFIPRELPLIVGTEQIADHERRAGRPEVAVIEPPVDVHHNAPGVVDPAAFRSRYDLDPDAATLVCVTRLAAELKLEGILAAIELAGDLGGSVQLVVAGDGPMRGLVTERAERANARAGRRVVVLTGELHDPRPAYAAADVCLGMGGSALRAMALGRPVVVQGERGFWELLSPETVTAFDWTGWYGIGEGVETGVARLRRVLEPLLADAERLARLGAYSRRLVEERFALERAAVRQLECYERAVAAPPCPVRRRIGTAAASTSGLVGYRVRRRVEDLLGRASLDDFNAKPVAGYAPASGAARA